MVFGDEGLGGSFACLRGGGFRSCGPTDSASATEGSSDTSEGRQPGVPAHKNATVHTVKANVNVNVGRCIADPADESSGSDS